LDDATLLERFAADRDEAAFELLVWRHGPMVLGVCRRRLRDIHAAEDAFQATFLALARRAKSIRRRASVAGWLYRVAGRVALAARERSTRRTEQPLDTTMLPGREPEPADATALRELRITLDDAIGRLPLCYREPLILTCFAGRSHAEAARELGCAVRTIESRLGRARQKLRAVLLRRGFLPAGGLAAALAPADAPAGVVASLVVATVRSAGRGAASISVETLTQGVLHAMLLSKIKIAGAAMFMAGFVGLGTGGWIYQSQAVGQDSGGEPKTAQRVDAPFGVEPPAKLPSKPPDRKDRVQTLLRELTEALADDSSGDATKQLQELLKGIEKRQRERHEQEVQAALADLAKHIAILKQITQGDPNRQKAVSDFDGAFHDLIKRLSGRAAANHPDGNGPAFGSRFSAGVGARGFEFGTRLDQPADVFANVTKVDGDLVVINVGQGAGVVIGQEWQVYRISPSPVYLGSVRILSVAPTEAVGRVTGPKRGEVHVGDEVKQQLAR
jgi:RNA polymerase sigma factor (sigma-70 family)